MTKKAALVLPLLLLLKNTPLQAFVTPMSPSLAHEILSETVPTAFAPFALAVEDFSIEWEGAPIEGVELKLAPETLQWVRVADVIVLPRARLLVTASKVEFGRISNAGFSQALVGASEPAGSLRAELPVAVMSGPKNPFEVSIQRGGREISGRAFLHFRPRAVLGEQRIFTDPSCSRFGVTAQGSAQSATARGWAYVGCRLAEVEDTGHLTSSLEAWVYWDNVGQEIQVGGIKTPSTSLSVWPLRLRADPGSVTLRSLAGDEMKLRYFTAKNYHRGFLGLGIGPYNDIFEGNGQNLATLAPVLTLYGSYFITETIRTVAFGAATIDRHLTTDFGLYMSTEYLRILDRRLVANLLLGAHVIGFRSQGKYYGRLGLPQGIELIFIDAFKKGFNFTAGSFLYPPIDGKSYYNIWFRWGSGKLFGEFNYIAWGERLNEEDIRARSVGLSIGFPLAKFL